MKKVVALGGGHGLSNVLRSLSLIDDIDITAIVSVADDGGSSGRLRHDLDVVAPGDVRSCLAALADLTHKETKDIDSFFEYRFEEGELDGHSLGNLILVALTRTTGSFEAAVETMSKLLNVRGKVLPATESSVVLCAQTASGIVRGQVEIEKATNIERVTLDPDDTPSLPGVLQAIEEADHILYAPGSLFTSLIPVVIIREISAALKLANAQNTMILNLSNRGPDTAGMTGDDHVSKVIEHGGRVENVLCSENGLMIQGASDFKIDIRRLSFDNETHDITLLSKALKEIIF